MLIRVEHGVGRIFGMATGEEDFVPFGQVPCVGADVVVGDNIVAGVTELTTEADMYHRSAGNSRGAPTSHIEYSGRMSQTGRLREEKTVPEPSLWLS